MLLGSHEKLLRALSAEVRARLFDTGIELCRGYGPEVARGLSVLLDTFPKEERGHSEAAMRLVGFLLASDREREARALLAALVKAHPGYRAPARWLEALDGPRLGRIGVTEQGKGQADGDWHLSGLLIARRVPVWVCVGAPGDDERYARAVEIARSIAIPGVASVLEHGKSEKGAPFLATARIGRSAQDVLAQKGSLDRDRAIAFCAEAVRILAALALSGVELPDAGFRRFVIDGGGRLWLRDLLGATRTDAERAGAAHLSLGRDFCRALLRCADVPRLGAGLASRLDAATDCVALARLLDDLG
jgi:hypothetical protein